MLVLNTNQGGGGENVLSNANVMTNYPDIDNSILLFPDNFVDSPTIRAQINWLAIHMFGWVVSKDNLINVVITPTTNAQPPQLWQYINNSWSQRLTNVDTLSQLVWMTIWKTIILPELIVSTSTSTLTVKVWVFHQDWTITYFSDPITYRYETTWPQIIGSNPSNRGNWTTSTTTSIIFAPSSKIITTNWIVVQEWDRVIAEFSANEVSRISFWSYRANNPFFRIKPIQFSID